MGTRKKSKSKHSLSSTPKGLVYRKGSLPAATGNPFEITGRVNKPKYEVHNRPHSKPKKTKHALESLQRRQTQLRTTLKSTKKSNVLIDRRIGQYDPAMSHSDQMLARLVKERAKQSQRNSKYKLNDDDDDILTHKGKKLDPNSTEPIYSDDDDDDFGNLEAADTELHFGGAHLENNGDHYGGSSSMDLANIYGQRKTELDELITRRKNMKAEKMRAKEAQIESIDKMDNDFAELSQMLLYRAEQPMPPKTTKSKQEDEEMRQWNAEIKEMMLKPKRRATDRTKTPEEIAKEEADRLHKLETRRLARMNGDFDEDELSDISLDKYHPARVKKKNPGLVRNPDEISDSEDEAGDDEPKAKFTADGLKYFDRNGVVIEKKEEEDDSDGDSHVDQGFSHPLEVGARVQGNYRAAEQFEGKEAWYDGEITKVHISPEGVVRYDVEYLDGDFEEDMLPENVRLVEKSIEEKEKIDQETAEAQELRFKRSKARDLARTAIPYVFEVPTTLEALHEIIAKYASTGHDATVIVQRIHLSNSVRLDHRNTEKMQNFYDVLLRRFMAIGDAVFLDGNGGVELARYSQLSALTKVLYAMAQDSPESAAAVWSRRIGILQNAHAKRLRDYELISDEEGERTPWPSCGTFLLLKALTAIFPVTDKHHHVVTPANLLLGQYISQTPITCVYDLILGVHCSALLLENGMEAKRIAPEALGFLASVFRLFSSTPGQFALPTFENAHSTEHMQELRKNLRASEGTGTESVMLRLEGKFAEGDQGVAASILGACFHIVSAFKSAVTGPMMSASEVEMLVEVSESLLTLHPKDLPPFLRRRLADVANDVSDINLPSRQPLRRASVHGSTFGITTLAPRMQDPERYSMSKDKGKKSVQTAIDRTRREYKREHKAVTRELRLDAQFIESERRTEKNKSDSKARAKRQKNFAWLEGEQAAMNQQVAQGGGLLKGGGTGAARSKAASAKLGIKKGGKF